MPNLTADPQNPTDLLGQPIAEGDIVAWGTTWGRSAALCVAEIVKVRFTREKPGGYGRQECSQDVATDYTLRLRPIRSTGSVTWTDTTGEQRYVAASSDDVLRNPDRYEAKPKNVMHVKNIVKLDPAQVDAAMDRLTAKARKAAR